MTNDFNLPDNIPTVDDDLYRPDTQSTPWITWLGKADNHNSETGGKWVIKADSIDGLEPGPEGWWKLENIKFGTNPNNPSEPTWVTSRLRCVPIGVRKQQIIKVGEGSNKKEYCFPFYTKAENRRDSFGNLVEGKYDSKYQVMIMLEGIPFPIMITLRGYTKTKCWDNEPNSQYGNREFPKGVEPVLMQYAADASKQKKTRIPWLCFWQIDLCPTFNNDKPVWVEVGKEETVFVNPFMVDMRTGDKGFPASRFVGTENFIAYQNLRRDVVLDWEAQWASAENLAAAGDAAYDYEDTSENEVKEDDVIPF